MGLLTTKNKEVTDLGRPRDGKRSILAAQKRIAPEKLIASMDLSAIGTMSEEELRLEVRRAAEELCRHGSDL